MCLLLLCYYDKRAGAGGGNYEEIVGFHNPKGIIADYRDFDEDPHNRKQNQHDGYHKQWPDTGLAQAVNGEPNKVSADQDPKSVIANYRNFNKGSYDRSMGHYERDNASEEHFGPKVTDRIIKETVKDLPNQQAASFDSQ